MPIQLFTCSEYLSQDHDRLTVTLISFILILFITIVAFIYLKDIWQSSDLNPIQQLSPLLTITQGISLYLFSVVTISIIWRYSSDLIKPNTTRSSLLFTIDSFTFIFSRGFFYVITVMKSYRIIFALNKNKLQRKSLRVQIFSNQKLILLLSTLITIVVWPGVSFFQALYEDKYFQVLLIFEQENIYNMIINCFEQLSILFLIACIPKSPHSDKLLNLTVIPLYIYVIWFAAGVFFICDDDQEDHAGEISMTVFIIWCSYILRTWVMFYLCIIRPLKQKIYVQSPFIPVDVIIQFRYFIEQKFCNQIFYKYLKYLDQADDIPISEDSLTQRYSYIQIFEIWIELKMKKDNMNGQQMPTHHITQNEQKLFEILSNVFQNKFLLTNTANTILKLYQDNEPLNYNFYTLNLQTTFIINCDQENN